MSSPDAHLMLKSKVSALSYVGAVISLIRTDGLVNSSGDGPLPVVNVADRPYFKVFKSNPQLTVVVVEPIRSLFTGEWTTVLAHRLSGSNGVFLGVMGRRIDPSILRHSSHPSPLERTWRFPCSTVTAQCWRVTRTPIR